MEYVFKTWDSIINSTLRPDNYPGFKQHEEQIKIRLKESELKVTELFVRLKEQTISLASKKKTGFFIQGHQSGLALLLDKIECYRQAFAGNEFPEIYEEIKAHLLFTYRYMEQYFFTFFDQDSLVPQAYLADYKVVLGSKINILQEKIAGGSQKELQLINLVCLFCSRFIHDSENASYRQILYQKKLLVELLKMVANNETGDKGAAIHNLLHFRNFNTSEFVHYNIDQINKETENLLTVEAKIKCLLWWRKEIVQAAVLKKTAAVPGTLSLKGHLKNWLGQEMNFLRKTSSLNHDTQKNNPPFYLRVTSTVKVLAILGRAFFDTNFIVNRNKKETFEWLAGHISTVGTDSVSYKTLLKRGSTPEERDKEMAKDILLKLFNQVRKY